MKYFIKQRQVGRTDALIELKKLGNDLETLKSGEWHAVKAGRYEISGVGFEKEKNDILINDINF